MSRLTGEQLFEIMGKLPDEFVTEALPLSLLGGAAGAAGREGLEGGVRNLPAATLQLHPGLQQPPLSFQV